MLFAHEGVCKFFYIWAITKIGSQNGLVITPVEGEEESINLFTPVVRVAHLRMVFFLTQQRRTGQ